LILHFVQDDKLGLFISSAAKDPSAIPPSSILEDSARREAETALARLHTDAIQDADAGQNSAPR
jgi:hypothetical protein